MCGEAWDADVLDLISMGWEKAQMQDEICGPSILDGDVLALWQEYDMAGDFIELVGLLLGVRVRETISSLALRGMVASASVHVNGRRLRRADVWVTVTDDQEVFQGIFVRRDVFVSPEVLEMIQVAAVGDES